MLENGKYAAWFKTRHPDDLMIAVVALCATHPADARARRHRAELELWWLITR
jgi:hypothetical protein